MIAGLAVAPEAGAAVGWKQGAASSGCIYSTVFDAIVGAYAANKPNPTIFLQPGTVAIPTVYPLGSSTSIPITVGHTVTIGQGNATCTGVASPLQPPGAVKILAPTVPVADRAFLVSAGGALTLRDLTVTGGSVAVGDGGLVWVNNGTFDAFSVAFNGGSAANGGCLAASESGLVAVDFTSCFASASGGAVSFNGSSVGLTWVGGSVTGTNTANVAGGGLYAYNADSVYVEAVEFDLPSAGDLGGAMHFQLVADAEVYASTVANARADYGGAITVVESGFTLRNSALSYNRAYYASGGIYAESAFSASIVDSTISYNSALDATLVVQGSGGGIYAYPYTSASSLVLSGDTLVLGNRAGNGAGLLVAPTAIAPLTSVTMRDTAAVVANIADDSGSHGGGAYVSGNVKLFLEDDAAITDNQASSLGGGIAAWNTAEVVFAGSAISAPTASATSGGVRIARNFTDYSHDLAGTAIYANAATITGENVVMEGKGEAFEDGYLVWLVLDSSMTVENGHFLDGSGGFYVEDSQLDLRSDFTTCDPLAVDASLDPLFAADRYCSEIRNNHGGILTLEGDSVALIQTTALTDNLALVAYDPFDPPIGMLMVQEGSSLTFTTVVSHGNSLGFANDPSLVEVYAGGEFISKQSSFGDAGFPSVRYRALSTGDFRRNATAYDVGTPAVHVETDVTLTGLCNVGSWDGAGTQPVGLEANPGWVTTARGDLHLDCNSTNVLDQCQVDGPQDIDGNLRPFSALGVDTWWDVGAVELREVCP